MTLTRAAVPDGTAYQGTTSVSPTWPAGYTPTAGHLALLVVFSKHRTEATEPDPITGWTKVSSVVGGVAGAAQDAGRVRATVYTRELAGGDAAPTVTLPAGTGAVLSTSRPYVFAGDAGPLDVLVTPYSYATSTTAWSAASASPVDLVAGDELIFAHGATSDVATGIGTRTLTGGSFSVGSTAEQIDAANANGDQLRWALANNEVASGQSTTTAVTLGVTLSGAGSTGVGALVRVRELLDKLYAFDGQAEGAAVATGGDFVSLNGAPTYTTDAKHGTSALRTVGGAQSVRIFHGQTRHHSGSVYVKATGLDTSVARAVQFDTVAGQVLGSVRLHSDGKFDLGNGSNSRAVASTVSWVPGTWHRIDWQLSSPSVAGAATLTARVFLSAEGATADDELSTVIAAGDALRIQVGGLSSDADAVVTTDTVRVRHGLQWLGPFAAAPPVQLITTGLAVELAEALAQLRQRVRSTGLPAELDDVLAAGRRRVRTTGVPVELDQPLPAGRRKARTSGLPVELDAGAVAGRAKRRGTGLAGEATTALPTGRAKRRTTGLLAEAELALGALRRKLRATGLPAELDAPLAALRRRIHSTGLAAELDDAVGSAGQVRTTGVAAEVDQALPAGRARRRTTGLAAELAVPLAALRRKLHRAGVAVELDTPVPAPRAKLRRSGLPAGVDAPLAGTRQRGRTTGVASELAEALPAGRAKVASTGLAVELDDALSVGSAALVLPGRPVAGARTSSSSAGAQVGATRAGARVLATAGARLAGAARAGARLLTTKAGDR